MISFEQAQRLIENEAVPGEIERVATSDASGLVLAEDLPSPIDLPSFRNSAMDGYMVRSDDLAKASAQHPVCLPLKGVVYAGDDGVTDLLSEPATISVMTGAPVAKQFDAVVPLENIEIQNQSIVFTAPVRPGDHIREAGEDMRRGQAAFKRGDYLSPERIMLLAALGVAEVAVHQAPPLYIFSTGDELASDSVLTAGKIHDANRPFLLLAARRAGFVAHDCGRVGDRAEELVARIKAISGPATIVSSGAASKGEHDFVPQALQALGAEIIFQRPNIRPGKPVLFARLPDGKHYFGLPGNPAAAAMGFRIFVMPLMWGRKGLPPEKPLMARLAASIRKKGNFRQFVKAQMGVSDQGELWTQGVDGQEAFKIAPLAETDAFMVLTEDRLSFEKGEMVPVYPYQPYVWNA